MGDNIKTDLQEVGWAAMIGLIWLRIGTGGGPRKRGNEHAGSISAGNLLTSGEPVSFSRKTLFNGISTSFVRKVLRLSL
jgi:hypothetical protein